MRTIMTMKMRPVENILKGPGMKSTMRRRVTPVSRRIQHRIQQTLERPLLLPRRVRSQTLTKRRRRRVGWNKLFQLSHQQLSPPIM